MVRALKARFDEVTSDDKGSKFVETRTSELYSKDMRIDGRGRFQRQDVTLEVDCLYNAEGSA